METTEVANGGQSPVKAGTGYGLGIIGESARLKRVLKQVEVVAPTSSTVLVLGETGTGKELIARAVHNLSSRRDCPFVSTNCSSIPAGLLESELFGHEKGAFTGAVARGIGRFELADRGTILLQEQEFERLGSTRTIRANFRLVAATNRDLPEMVEKGTFRSDLYYRLNVFPIETPPLRERREDIPLLVWHFVRKFAQGMNKRIETIRQEDMEVLVHCSWPGNVRELQNIVERSVVLTPGTVLHSPSLSEPICISRNVAPAVRTLADAERKHILQTLRETDWVIGGPGGAAAQLAVRRTTLLYKMRRLGISRPQN
jgi:formate hydrogenlyase transcriptional activator